MQFLIGLGAVFLASTFGTAIVKRVARRRGWLAAPRKDRWHAVPTALYGGVGFYPVFLAGAVVMIVVVALSGARDDSGVSGGVRDQLVLCAWLLLGSLVLFMLGLWDDMHGVRPAAKLIAQLIAASPFIFVGGVFSASGLAWLDVLLTYLWFVGIINAINMLDNMDGLASGIVVLAGATVVGLSLGQGAGRVGIGVWLSALLVAGVLGFLLHNYPPASIFMGDSGSLALGFLLAGLAIPTPLNGYMGLDTETPVARSVLVLLVPATTLAVPIFDTTLVALTRKWRAQKASQGGKDHSSHRLVGLGMSELRAVWTLYGLGALGGAAALLLQVFRDQSLPLTAFFVVLLALTGVYLGHVKVQVTEPERLPPAWTPIVSRILYKRHAAEVLLDTLQIVGCFYLAYVLRFDGVFEAATRQAIFDALPLVVGSCLAAFWLAGIYRGQWHLVTVVDLPRYVASVGLGTLLSIASTTMITRFGSGHSRSAYLIFGALLLLCLFGSRLSFRLFDTFLDSWQSRAGRQTPVLIYGAGRAGKLLHDEVLRNSKMSGYIVLGFVDDDDRRVGRRLCGLPVAGVREWQLHLNSQSPEIWISSRAITDEQARQLARQWPDAPPLRRMQLRLEVVGDITKPDGEGT